MVLVDKIKFYSLITKSNYLVTSSIASRGLIITVLS